MGDFVARTVKNEHPATNKGHFVADLEKSTLFGRDFFRITDCHCAIWAEALPDA